MSLHARNALTPRMPRMTGMTLALAALIALVASAVGVIYTKHESRKLFIELQSLSKERDALNIEWGRLQLEQSTYAAHSLIESKAAGPLALKRPASSEIFLITDNGDYRFVGLEPVSEELAQLLRDTPDTLAEASR